MTDLPDLPEWPQSFNAASDAKLEFLAEALSKFMRVKEAWPLARAARRLEGPFDDWADDYSYEDTRTWLNMHFDALEKEVAAQKRRYLALRTNRRIRGSS